MTNNTPSQETERELRTKLTTRINQYFDCYLAEDGVLLNDLMSFIAQEVLKGQIEVAQRFVYRGWCIPEMEVYAEDYIAKLQAQLQGKEDQGLKEE